MRRFISSFIYRLSLRADCVLGTLLEEIAISRDLGVGLGREGGN